MKIVIKNIIKILSTIIVSVLLSYIGYIFYKEITLVELKYMFAVIWGAIMITLDTKTLNFFESI